MLPTGQWRCIFQALTFWITSHGIPKRYCEFLPLVPSLLFSTRTSLLFLDRESYACYRYQPTRLVKGTPLAFPWILIKSRLRLAPMACNDIITSSCSLWSKGFGSNSSTGSSTPSHSSSPLSSSGQAFSGYPISSPLTACSCFDANLCPGTHGDGKSTPRRRTPSPAQGVKEGIDRTERLGTSWVGGS